MNNIEFINDDIDDAFLRDISEGLGTSDAYNFCTWPDNVRKYVCLGHFYASFKDFNHTRLPANFGLKLTTNLLNKEFLICVVAVEGQNVVVQDRAYRNFPFFRKLEYFKKRNDKVIAPWNFIYMSEITNFPEESLTICRSVDVKKSQTVLTITHHFWPIEIQN